MIKSIKKKNHNSVWTSEGAFNELDHYIRLKLTTQVRLKPHIHPKP